MVFQPNHPSDVSPQPAGRSNSDERGQAPPLPGRDLLGDVSKLKPVTSDIKVEFSKAPKEGTWLFKEDEIVKGPVSASVLLEKIDAEELHDHTPLAREMGSWIPLGDIPFFHDCLQEAAIRRQREAKQLAHEAAVRKRKSIRYASAAALVVFPLLMGSLIGWKTKAARPWDRHDKWMKEVPAFVEIKKASPSMKFSTTDKDQSSQLAMKEKRSGGQSGGEGADNGLRAKQRKNKFQRGQGKKGRKAKKNKLAYAESPEGEQPALETLSKKQVTDGLKKAKRGIGSCLKTEFMRNTHMPSQVTVAFSVANNGKAINIKVLERELRKTPLPKCLQKTISKVQWPKFYGERKYVEFPFNIGRK